MHQTPQEFTSFAILGGGQHAKLINELARKQGLQIVGWIDKSTVTKFIESKNFLHYTDDSQYLELRSNGVGLLLGIASHKLWAKRAKLIGEFHSTTYTTPNIIGENVIVSENVKLGQGNQLIGNSFIQHYAQIGSWSIINSGVIIEHDVTIGDSVHIAPGVIVCGGVSIGNGSYIGAGTTVLEGVTIGENVLIGAGSLVIKDVPQNEIHFGAPCVYRGTRP